MSTVNGIQSSHSVGLTDKDKDGLGGNVGASIALMPMFGVQHTDADKAIIDNQYKKANPIFG